MVGAGSHGMEAAAPPPHFMECLQHNLGVRRIEAGMDARGGATGALYMISIYFQGG